MKSVDIRIRHAESHDADAIKAIYTCPNAQAQTLQLPYPSGVIWDKRITHIPDNVYVFVAEINNHVVGNLGMEICTNARRRHCASFGMGVHDDYQGQGVGGALITAMLDLADNWLNLHRIELTVYNDNQAAIALYQKFDFVIEGELVDFAFRQGQFINAYQMARIKKAEKREHN